MSVNLVTSVWESWCSILKKEALIKYIKYRISNMTPVKTISKMSSKIRRLNLTEKKN